MGLSDIVPGVSSTVLALLFGFYEDLLNLYYSITEVVRVMGKNVFGGGVNDEERTALRSFDGKFLSGLVLGYGSALVSVSWVVSFFLERYQSYVYAVFLGVMIVSIGEVIDRLHGWNWKKILVFLGGFVIALTPSLIEESVLSLDFRGVFMLPVGLLASIGGVIPGFSGGFVLVFFGVYDEVLQFLSGEFQGNVDLVWMGIGAVIGYGLFARYVKRVYESYQQMFLATIGGLITGSLWVLWPFLERENEVLEKVWPWQVSGGEGRGVTICLVLSMIAMVGVKRFAQRGKK